MMLPKCGTLLTYGRAEVIKTFRFPSSGRIACFFVVVVVAVVAVLMSRAVCWTKNGRNFGGDEGSHR